MKKTIENCLPNYWKLNVKDGNEYSVTDTLRRQLTKLQSRETQSKRLKKSAPLAIILFFRNGNKFKLRNVFTLTNFPV